MKSSLRHEQQTRHVIENWLFHFESSNRRKICHFDFCPPQSQRLAGCVLTLKKLFKRETDTCVPLRIVNDKDRPPLSYAHRLFELPNLPCKSTCASWPANKLSVERHLWNCTEWQPRGIMSNEESAILEKLFSCSAWKRLCDTVISKKRYINVLNKWIREIVSLSANHSMNHLGEGAWRNRYRTLPRSTGYETIFIPSIPVRFTGPFIR